MNTSREPLTPDAVDALLSAQLDGELAAAARELGLSESEALAQLTTMPGIEDRRRTLTRARDLLAARPPLEPAVEDRLVATAMARDDLAIVRERRGRLERQWRVLVAAGSVAAAVAVVIGVSTMQHHASSKASLGAAATRRPGAAKGQEVTPPASRGRVDFGDVTSGAALRSLALPLLSNHSNVDSVGGSTSPAKALTAPQAADATQGTRQAARGSEYSATAPLTCTASIRQRYRIAAAPAVVGTGEVADRPVVILIFDGAGTPVAYVVSAADCSLLRKQYLRR